MIKSSAINAQAQGDTITRVWLSGIALLVLAMVTVGGATRLTDSGLSITEWLPILGAIPPLSDAAWQVAFEKYKQIPEYQTVNQGMSLAAFKYIYWWEWSHRFLGRFIGIAFAIPFAVLYLTRRLRAGLPLKLLGVLALGALQGFFGWYMVKSGLVDRVDVSHYRLALHLVTAFLILALVVWLVLELAPETPRTHLDTLTGSHAATAWIIVAMVFIQTLFGAFVAGTKAGVGYNTWPLMDGQIVPDGLLQLSPWYLNTLENIIAIQFNHRVMAYALIALSLWHTLSVWRASDDDRCMKSAIILAAALIAQAALGVATLLAVSGAGGIPLGLGLVHQSGAAVIVVIAVWHLHRLTRARRL